jgi:hypothetical protein
LFVRVDLSEDKRASKKDMRTNGILVLVLVQNVARWRAGYGARWRADEEQKAANNKQAAAFDFLSLWIISYEIHST